MGSQSKMMVGSRKDEHGCLGPAGYVWCDSNQACMRPWEGSCPGGTQQCQEFCAAKMQGDKGPGFEMACACKDGLAVLARARHLQAAGRQGPRLRDGVRVQGRQGPGLQPA